MEASLPLPDKWTGCCGVPAVSGAGTDDFCWAGSSCTLPHLLSSTVWEFASLWASRVLIGASRMTSDAIILNCFSWLLLHCSIKIPELKSSLSNVHDPINESLQPQRPGNAFSRTTWQLLMLNSFHKGSQVCFADRQKQLQWFYWPT